MRCKVVGLGAMVSGFPRRLRVFGAQMMIARLLYCHRAWFRIRGCCPCTWLVPSVVDLELFIGGG